MGHNSRLVIMFRDPTKEPSAANTDQQPISEYHDKFVGAGYVPVSFPVIEPHSTLTPQWLLAEIFPRTSNFTGLIFTSSNAVKALSGAYQAALASPLGFIDLLPSPTATAVEMVESVLQPQWQRLLSLPIFVVGKATATACHNLLGPTAPAPLVIHGQDSGSAVNLLKIITNSLTASPQSTHLLFLSGDRRRSTLPDGLSERGIQFSEVTVYET
ncbi:uroporphyrinogen-III synthase, partial [Spiromyces aspiralis]